MESTKVKVKCISKKDAKHYDVNYPIRTTIELEVPYDQTSVYHKMSGGTNLELHTVNQEAAKMFEIGGDYDIIISPSKGE